MPRATKSCNKTPQGLCHHVPQCDAVARVMQTSCKSCSHPSGSISLGEILLDAVPADKAGGHSP